MLLDELYRDLEHLSGIRPSTIRQIGHHLRESGLLPAGRSGRRGGYPAIGPRETAVLLIALGSGAPVRAVGDTVPRYYRLPRVHAKSGHPDSGDTFGQNLERILGSDAGSSELRDAIDRIEIGRSEPRARILWDSKATAEPPWLFQYGPGLAIQRATLLPGGIVQLLAKQLEESEAARAARSGWVGERRCPDNSNPNDGPDE